jgi:dTDP-4-amino-4,6-dideoxygalactose transaminase
MSGMKSKIWLSSPHMGGTEEQFVKEAFETNWIAPLGPNVNGFEQDLELFLDNGCHAAALSSGTAGLHLALVLLGVKQGDEVICQSMTFSATANPITYVGATPVFVDSEKDTWNISPELMEVAVKDRISKGKKPKAIIPVHLYGMPAKMHELLAVAGRYGIPVIEDAAEALGSSINGRKCGTFGTISILSFNGNKIITTSGGGALVSHDAAIVKDARFLSTQARDEAPHYQHSQVGYNYRMSNLCAGVGRGQMEVLAKRVEQRRKIYNQYFSLLNGKKGIHFVSEPVGYFSNRWLTTILIDPDEAGFTREELRIALEKDNIESRPLWKPMHMQPVFAHCPFYDDGISEKLFQNGLCLPSGSNLSSEDMERVFKVINTILK